MNRDPNGCCKDKYIAEFERLKTKNTHLVKVYSLNLRMAKRNTQNNDKKCTVLKNRFRKKHRIKQVGIIQTSEKPGVSVRSSPMTQD